MRRSVKRDDRFADGTSRVSYLSHFALSILPVRAPLASEASHTTSLAASSGDSPPLCSLLQCALVKNLPARVRARCDDLCGHLRDHRAGRDGVHLDAVVRQLPGERLGELDHRRLRRRVRADPGRDPLPPTPPPARLTILPLLRRARIPGRTARHACMAPKTFTSKASLHSAGSHSSIRPMAPLTPALLTRTSTRPHRRSTSSTSALTSSRCLTSVGLASASMPSAASAARADSSSSARPGGDGDAGALAAEPPRDGQTDARATRR